MSRTQMFRTCGMQMLPHVMRLCLLDISPIVLSQHVSATASWHLELMHSNALHGRAFAVQRTSYRSKYEQQSVCR